MNSLSLLLWIVLGLALQFAIYFVIGLVRNWRAFRTLRRQVEGLELPPEQMPVDEPEHVAAPGWDGFRAFRVERKQIEDAAQSICSFYLVPEDSKPLPAFKPGQFLTFRLQLGGGAEEHAQIVRCYSLSDAPRQDYYRVSIKRALPPAGSRHPAGRSSNYFHDQVQVGDVLQVRAPAGHFHIERSDAPAVLIGGGIGITPMLSMLNWCMAEQPEREVWLFYGVRNGDELILRAEFEALAAAHSNLHLRFCYSNPLPAEEAGRDFHCGARIDVGLLRMELALKPYEFYICGPTPMMETLVPALGDWGVPDARIHFEAFGPASIKRRQVADGPASGASDSAEGVMVTFSKSNKQLLWSPFAGSLLDFAEANGIEVNSGCRAGGCGSCETTIRAGEVAYRQAPDYDPEPGRCLLCMCTPKTSLTLEA
jgi:ferredoxin-NADP reductase